MKARLLFIAVVFFTFSSGKSRAIENPVGSGTVPPSGPPMSGNNLIRSPNPIDTSANLLITGNIRRGRHFRGIVPYRGPSDFGDTLGSSSLDSFLRDSAGSEDLGRFSGRYEPYYSPSKTVTAIRPGRSAIFRPPTAGIAGAAASPDAIGTLPALPKQGALSDRGTAAGTQSVISNVWEPVRDIRFRPMSRTTQELEKILLSEVEKYQQSSKLIPADDTGKEYRQQMEQFQRDLKQASDKADELERSLMDRYDSSRLFTTRKPSEDVSQSRRDAETLIPQQQPDEDKQFDVYEQMKQQIDNLQKTLESQLAEIAKSAAAETETQEGTKEKSTSSGKFFEWDIKRDKESLETRVDLSTRAKAILGEHKTFASYSEDKFNQYLRAAEDYLKQGRYYRAADAYTLASIYKPDDPLVYAGKSHALLAAGEYMSSALFLARALEIFPEYARFKIDIVAMSGNRDMLESRMVDIVQWLKKSNAPELQFLLSYVYYQMNRLEWAKRAVGAAYEKMPNAPAVITLKEAIEIADSRQRTALGE